MPSRQRSRYAWGPRANKSQADENVSAAAEHLFTHWLASNRPSSLGLLGSVTSAPAPLIASTLDAEAARIGVPKKNWAKRGQDAVPFVEWALAATNERNHQVIARFAIRAAEETTEQPILTSVLGDDYPRRWRSSRHVGQRRTLKHEPGAGGAWVAFYPNMLSPLMTATSPYVSAKAVNIHEGYHGLRATRGWSLDPIRPPMSAVRYTASLIEKFKGHGPLKVLAIEPGLTAAVVGLAWFIPAATIYMYAPVLGDQVPSTPSADAVVVNLVHCPSSQFSN